MVLIPPEISGYFHVKLNTLNIPLKNRQMLENMCEKLSVDYTSKELQIQFREYVNFDRYEISETFNNLILDIEFQKFLPSKMNSTENPPKRIIIFKDCCAEFNLTDEADITKNEIPTYISIFHFKKYETKNFYPFSDNFTF